MSVPTLKAVLAVTSPSALANMGHDVVLVASAKTMREFIKQSGGRASLILAVDAELAEQATAILQRAGIEHELVITNVGESCQLRQALAPHLVGTNFVVIHDANRPLTHLSQFHRTLEALLGDVDAARGSTPFTETLKAVSADQLIVKTIERSQVRRISTPEVVRVSAIDHDAQEFAGWFLPLKPDTRIGYVDSDPESIRVESAAELELLESFLHWQQSVAARN